MKKKILILIGIFAIIGFGVYKYAYKPQRNIATEKPEFNLSTTELATEFETNDSLANTKYLNKTISIYGKITNIDLKTNAILVDEKIYITITNAIDQNLKVSSRIKVQARYIGFDDLLEEFRMDQGTILK